MNKLSKVCQLTEQTLNFVRRCLSIRINLFGVDSVYEKIISMLIRHEQANVFKEDPQLPSKIVIFFTVKSGYFKKPTRNQSKRN
jgi:hypothetical protein